MISLPVSSLLAGPAEFDLFHEVKAPDDELVLRGLYPALPVADGVPVWGFPILRSAARAGLNDVQCSLVSGTPGELLELALRLEGRKDGYSWDEKVAVYRFLEKHRCEPERLLPLVSSTGSFILQVEKFLSLPEPLRRMVRSAQLDLKSASALTELPGEVLELFPGSARLSVSERRIVLQLILEIMKRDGLGAERTVALAMEILSAERPADAVRRLRMPELTGFSETVEAIRKDCLAGSGVTLQPPDFFEGSSYSVTFDFGSSRQLMLRIAALKRLQEKCDELLGILR